VIPTPRTFDLDVQRGVARITLNRPERLNSLTFESYAELADTFEALGRVPEARAITLTGTGKGFCSGGDVNDIIAELFARDMRGLLEFTRLTGRLIANIRSVGRPVIAAVNGVNVVVAPLFVLVYGMWKPAPFLINTLILAGLLAYALANGVLTRAGAEPTTEDETAMSSLERSQEGVSV
jgi:hypothetical protein